MDHSSRPRVLGQATASKAATRLSRFGRLAVAAGMLAVVGFAVSPRDVSAQATVGLRLGNFSDAASVSILFDGEPRAAGLGTGTTGAHEPVAAGPHTVSVVGDSAGTALFDGAVEVASDSTLVVVGAVGSNSVLVLADDRTLQPPGQAKLRFVHLASDVPAVDLESRSGSKLASGIAYGDIGDYSVVPAGEYSVDVRLAGESDVALTLPAVSIGSGQVVTYFITGQLSANTLKVIPVVDNEAAAPSAGTGLARQLPGMTPSQLACLVVGSLLVVAGGWATFRPRPTRSQV